MTEIKNCLDSICEKIDLISGDQSLIDRSLKVSLNEFTEKELSQENIRKKFLTPHPQFTSNWLDNLQE